MSDFLQDDDELETALIDRLTEDIFMEWLQDRYEYHFLMAWCPICTKNIDKMDNIAVTKKLNDDITITLCPECNLDEQLKYYNDHISEFEDD